MISESQKEKMTNKVKVVSASGIVYFVDKTKYQVPPSHKM